MFSAMHRLPGLESLLRIGSISEWNTTMTGLSELHKMIFSNDLPSRRKAEWATTASGVIHVTIECCAPAVLAAAHSGSHSATALTTIGDALSNVLCIFLICFHADDMMFTDLHRRASTDTAFSGTWLKLEGRLRHGLPRIINALLSLTSHLPSLNWDASLLHGLTAAIRMRTWEASISGGAHVSEDALVGLHCTHLRVGIAIVTCEMSRSLQPATNLLVAGWPGFDWLSGLYLLHSSPLPQESDVRRWQPLLPLLIRSSQLARDLLLSRAVSTASKDLIRMLYEQGLQAPLALLVRFKDGASGCVWRFRCALEAMKAALDPHGPLQCNDNTRSLVEPPLLSEAVLCMMTALGKAGSWPTLCL